jgi:methylated-DNA-[protein]-cysteine S-methyltransferase
MTIASSKPIRARSREAFLVDRLATPIGTARVVTDAEGWLRAFDWEDHVERIRQLLRLQYGAVDLQESRAPKAIRSALRNYFEGDLEALQKIEWRIAGTPFQRKVWTALPSIRAGTTMTYGAFAAALGSPNAMRAVGHANGSNPISLVIPCHRLIAADGSLVKYGSGLERKRWLLRHEGVAV